MLISNKESKPIFQNYLEMELQNDDNWPDSLISAMGGYGHAQGSPPPMEAPRGSERSECWSSVGTGCSRRNTRPRVLTEAGKSRVDVLDRGKKGDPDMARATASTGNPTAPGPQSEKGRLSWPGHQGTGVTPRLELESRACGAS